MRELDLSKNIVQPKIIQTPYEASHGLRHVESSEEIANRQQSESFNGMNASNLEPVSPAQEIAAPVDDSKPYDYFQMKLRGVNDGDIWNISTKKSNFNKSEGKPPVNVNMPDREEAWEKYGKEVFKDDRTIFDSQFDNTTKKLVEFNDNVKKDLYFAYTDADLVTDTRQAFASTRGVDTSKPGLLNTSPETLQSRTGYIYDSYGALQATQSRAQTADDNGYYIKYGKKKLMSDYTLFTDKPEDYDALVLKTDYDGSITGEAGKVYWNAANEIDNPMGSIKGSEIRSVWGPNSLYNNWAQDFGGAFVNSLVTNIPSILGSLEEVAGIGLESIGLETIGTALQRQGNRYQNLSSSLYFQSSEMQNMGMEDSHMRELGGLVGMVVQAALTGGSVRAMAGVNAAARGIGAEATALTAKELAEVGLGKLTMKQALSAKNSLSSIAKDVYAAQKSASVMKTGFALMMSDGFYQGAKEAGLGKKERALVFGASFATNMLLMGRGAKWFAPNTGQVWNQVLGKSEAMNVAKDAFPKMFKQDLQAYAANVGKAVEDVSAAEAKIVANSTKSKVMAFTIDAAKKLKGTMNSSNPLIAHMTTAPIEFGMLHVAGNGIQGVHDWLAEDNMNEQGRLNTPGEGLFKDKESRWDLADGLGHSLLTGLVMGAYGGIGEMYAYRKNPQARQQERTVTDFLFAGKGEELKTAFEKMHKEEWFGSSLLDANNNVISKGQKDPTTGQVIPSLNDIGYNSAKASFDALEEVYVTSGIKQWHLGVKDAKGVNQRYLKDVFDKQFAAVLETVIDPTQVAKDAVELVTKKRDVQERLKNATTDQEKLTLQKELDVVDSELNPFLESVAKQNSSGKKVISNVESRAIRNGMVRSRYASGKNPITNLPTFGVDLSVIKGVKSDFGTYQSMAEADVVDALNKRASDLIDTAVIGKARDENNTEVLSIVEDIKGGVNSDILSRVQTLHGKHLTSGVRPSEKLALDNMISELQNAHDANSETIISELSAKYGVEVTEDNKGDFQDIYNEVLAKDPNAKVTHGATIEALSNTDSTINRINAEVGDAYKKGSLTDAEILKNVYTSNNAGFSFDDIIKSIESSDFTNPNDINLLENVIRDIVTKTEILDINKEIYSKLDNQISLLNDKITPTDKDVDDTLKGSIKNELFDLFDRAFRLADKSRNISSQARELFDASFVNRDSNIRLHSIDKISDIILFDNNIKYKSAEVNETLALIDADKGKIENLRNDISIVENKITVLEELRNNKTITDDQIKELNDLKTQSISLTYDILSSVVSAEHKIHQIFNSEHGERFYKECVYQLNEFYLRGQKEENVTNFGLGHNSHAPEITPSDPNQSLDSKSIKDNLNRSWYYDPKLLNASGQSENVIQRSYAYQNAINSLTNIKRHSPKTFYENYKAWEDYYIKSDPNFIAPSFEQQKSIYQSVAFLLDPKIDGIKSKNFIENSLSVLGFAGVGKTKVMVPAIIDLYLKENQNRGIKTREIVVFTAPHAKQRENLKSSIEKINIKEDENKPLVDLKTILDDKEPKLRDLLTDRILVIDEASELSKEDVLKLKELQKKYGFKILNLIDESQITGQKGQLVAPVLDSQKTTPVTDVHRTGIYDIVRLQQIFREPLFNPATSKFFVNYSPTEFTETDGGYAVKGVKLRGNEFTSITEQSNSFVTDLKKDIADGVAGKTVFVVATDADRETLVNELSKSGINKDTLESSIKTLYGKETTAKGLQFDRVYVNLKESSIVNETEYYKALLTAASRGVSFVDIITTKSSASIISTKKGSLFSDNAEYAALIEKSYKEYAAKQPELIDQILKNATDGTVKSNKPEEPAKPSAGSPTGPPTGPSSIAQNSNKNTSGGVPVKNSIKDADLLEDTFDPENPDTFENIGTSFINEEGKPYYVKANLSTKDGQEAIVLTDGIEEHAILVDDLKENFTPVVPFENVVSVETSNNSIGQTEGTVIKEFHSTSNDGIIRVSSLNVELFPTEQQNRYNAQKDHLLKNKLYNPFNPLEGYLKKVFINEYESGSGANKKTFKKGIYNVVDTQDFKPKDFLNIFGTETPELVDNRYFIFGLETNIDGFKGNVDALASAIEEASKLPDPASYFDKLVSKPKDEREHQINRDRFVDRVNAYKIAVNNAHIGLLNKVTELSTINIKQITNGNTVFDKSATPKNITLAELFKPKQSLKEQPQAGKDGVVEGGTRLRTEDEVKRIKQRNQKLIDNNNKIVELTGKDNAGEALDVLGELYRSKVDEANANAKKRYKEGMSFEEKDKIVDEEFEKSGVGEIDRLISHLNDTNDTNSFKTTSLSQEAKDIQKESDEAHTKKVRKAGSVGAPTSTPKVNGMNPVEMDGKTVFFSDPVLLYNTEGISNTTIVQYKKDDGGKVFEPGYYVYYTLDPSSSTRGMIKVKSSVVDKTDALSFFSNYFTGSKNKGSFLSNAFYDDMNRFISTNRYFFDKSNNPKNTTEAMYTIVPKDKGDITYKDYRVQYIKTDGTIDLKETQKRINKIKELIKLQPESPDVKLHSFPASAPHNRKVLGFNSLEKLSVNLKNINWPQIVTSESNVVSAINTKPGAETNPFLEDSNDFSLDTTTIPSPDPNAPKPNLLAPTSNVSSEPSIQGKPEFNVTEEQKSRDRKAKEGLANLYTFFPGTKAIERVIKNISKQIVDRSNLSRFLDADNIDNAGDLKGSFNIDIAIEEAFKFYKDSYNKIKDKTFEIAKDGEVLTKTTDELTYNDVLLSNGKQDVINAYFNAQIAKESNDFRPVFDTVVKQLFPSKILYTEAEARAINNENGFGEEDTSVSSIAQRANRQRVSAAKGYADEMKLILNSISYTEYYKDKDGKIKKSPTKEGLVPDDVIAAKDTLASVVGKYISPSTNSFDAFKNDIIKSLRNSHKFNTNEKSDNLTFNKLASLYYTFFHDGFTEKLDSEEFTIENPLEGYSYLDWVKNQNKIHEKMYDGLSINTPKKLSNDKLSDEAIIQKGKEASLILSEFSTVVTSNKRKEFQHVIVTKEGDYYTVTPKSNSVSEIAYNTKQALTGVIYNETLGVRSVNRYINQSINDAFEVSYTKNGEAINARLTQAEIDNLKQQAANDPTVIISNINDKTSTYGHRLDKEGISITSSDGQKRQIVKRDIQKNAVVYSFVSNENALIYKDVFDLFKTFGINDIITPKTIHSYIDENINRDAINSSFTNPLKKNVDKTTLAEIYYNLIEEVSKKQETAVETIVDGNTPEYDIEKGVLDWGFIQDLSTVQSYNTSKALVNWRLDPEGNKVYVIQNSNAISDAFANKNINKTIAENFHELLDTTSERSPMLDRNGNVLNPLFNDENRSGIANEYEIEKYTIGNGLEKDGVVGKAVKELTSRERHILNIDANFINLLIKTSPTNNTAGPKYKGFTQYSISIPGLEASGDIHYLNFKAFDSNSSPVLIKEGRTNDKNSQPKAEANWDYFAYSFLREFQKQRNFQSDAVQKFSDAIQKFDFNKLSGIKNIPTNSSISTKIQSFIAERDKLLDNPQIIQKFLDEVINSNGQLTKLFYDHLQATSSVNVNTHYKLVNGKIESGNSVNYRFTNSKERSRNGKRTDDRLIDDLFTLSNFSTIDKFLKDKNLSIEDILGNEQSKYESKISDEEINNRIKGFMRRIVTPRLKNFINDLHDNKISANKKTRNFFDSPLDLEESGDVNKRGLVRVVKSFDQKEWDNLPIEEKDRLENSYYRIKGGYYSNQTGQWVQYKNSKHSFTEINPFYEGYLLAYLNHGTHVNDIVIGNSRLYDNLEQLAHRTYSSTTPGKHYTIKPFGIGFKRSAKYMVYDDSNMDVKNPLARLFGNALKDSTNSVDGLEWQVGIDGILQQGSLGKNIVKDPFGHKKEIYTNIDPLNGNKQIFKSSTMNLRGYRKESDALDIVERKMMSIEKFEDNGKMVTLYDKLVEFEMDDYKLADWMFQVNEGVNQARVVLNDKGMPIDIRDTYLSRLMPMSVAKTYAGSAVVDFNKEFISSDAFDVDMNSREYVLDLNKEAIDLSSSISHQIIDTLVIGKENFELSKSNNFNLAAINNDTTAKLETITSNGIKTLLKEKVNTLIGNAIQIVGDISFSNHLPSLENLIRSNLAKEFNKGIKPDIKSSGAYVQYPGEFVTMHEIISDVLNYNSGQGFTNSQYKKALVKLKAAGIENPETLFGQRAGGLKAAKAYVVQNGKEVDIESFEYLSKILTPEQLSEVNRLNKEGKSGIDSVILTPKQKNYIINEIKTSGGKLTDYEVIMPFQQYVEFGFNNNPKDPFYYKNFDVDDILTFKSEDGREINYTDLGATPEERKLALGQLIQIHSISKNNLAYDRIIKNNAVEIKEKDGVDYIDTNNIYEKMFQYYENFISITEQFINRTPASTSASAFKGKVVGFNNDISNTILVSSKKNVIDNSDYDIDELHAVTKIIPAIDQKAFEPNSHEGRINKIIDNNINYYSEANNLIAKSTPVTTDGLADLINLIKGDKQKGQVKKFLNDVTSSNNQARSAMDGEQLPGILANAIKAYSHIYQSYAKVKGNHFTPIELFGKTYSRFFDVKEGQDSGHVIMNNLASVLQAAVDNNKLGYLGILNTNTTTANAVVAMTMMGVPAEDIFKFISPGNYKVSSVLKDIKRNLNIDESNKTTFNNVTKSWSSVIKKSFNDISLLNIQLKESSSQKQKEEITKTILENIDNLAVTMGMKAVFIPKRAAKVVINADSVVKGLDSTDRNLGEAELEMFDRGEDIDYSDALTTEPNESLSEFNNDKTIVYDFNKTIGWLESYSKNVAELEKIMIIGDGLSKVSKILSVNQGINGDSWKMYDYLKTYDELRFPMEAGKYLDTRPQKAVVNQFVQGPNAKMGDVEIASEKEIFDQASETFGNFLDFNKLMASLPKIRSYVASVYAFDKILSENVITNHPTFKIQEELFLSNTKQVRITKKDAYFKMISARNKVLSSIYIESLGKDIENTGLNYDYNTKTISPTSDISTPKGQIEYIFNLIALIKDMKANPSRFEKIKGSLVNENDINLNLFLENVQIHGKMNQDEFITIPSLGNASDSLKIGIQESMKQLKAFSGVDMESLLFHYHLIQDGLASRPGSTVELIDKKYFKNYDSFLSETHSSMDTRESSIALRYKDRLAVHMIDNVKGIYKPDNIKEDFNLNITYSDKGVKTYEGGLIPNLSRKPIGDFPLYVRANTPIPGEVYKEGSNTKTFAGLFKLKEITKPEIVPGASVDNPAWRYERVTNRVSEMLSSWSANSTVQETFGRADEGRTLHIIALNKINDLNKGLEVTIYPEETGSKFDILSKYRNGLYYDKSGELIEVKKFSVGKKTGLSITRSGNTPSIEGKFSASKDVEDFKSVSTIDFKEREEILKNTDPAIIPDYQKAVTTDYFTVSDHSTLVQSIANKSLDYPIAKLADTFLKSNMSARLNRGAIIFKSAIANPDAFKDTNVADINQVMAFYNNATGDIVFNSDKSNNTETIERIGLHEVTHSYSVDVLSRYNAGKPLKNNERVFAKYITDLHSYVKNNMDKALASRIMKDSNATLTPVEEYALSNPKEFLAEIFTRKSFQQTMLNMKAMNPEVAKLGVNSVWQEFVNAVKDFLFGGAIPKDLDSVFDEVMAVSSRYMEGESMMEISSLNKYDSTQGFNMYLPESMAKDASKDTGEKIQTPEELRASYFGSGIKIDKINNNNDFIDFLTRTNVKKGSNNPDDKILVGNLTNSIIQQMSESYSITNKFTYLANGKTYELDKITDRNEVENLAKQIITEKSNYEVTLKDNLVSYLKGNTNSSFSDDIVFNLPWLQKKFAVNPTSDIISLLSDSKFKSDFFDKETFNPIIIHSDSDISGKTSISIMDVTTRSLNAKLTPGSYQYIADFITKNNPDLIKKASFRLIKTESGMKKFNVMIAAMLIHSKNPNIVIDRLSIIKPTSKANAESHDFMYHDYLPEMKAILTDPSLKDILPKELKDLVNNPKAFDVPDVNYVHALVSNYFDVKERYFNEASEQGTPIDKRAFIYDGLTTDLQKNSGIIGHNIFKGDVKRIILKRIDELTEMHKSKEVNIIADEEMRYLSQALEYLDNKGAKQEKMEDINPLVKFLSLNYNISNPAYDMYRVSVMNAIETGKNKYISFKTGFDNILKDINQYYIKNGGEFADKSPIGISDIGYKRFKRLFIHTDATDNSGNVHSINSYSIHHSGNLKSLEALKKSEISQAEIKLGDYIVKSIKDSFIQKQISKGLSLDEATNWYNANWKDGMIPIMKRRASEKIFTKDFVSGMKQWASKYSKSNEFFDYMQDSSTSPFEVSDNFLFQAGNSPFGSAERMNSIGIYLDKSTGKVTLNGVTPDEIKKNLSINESDVEQNLEVVMAYFIMNHEQKTALDKTQSVYLAAQTLLHIYEAKSNDDPLGGKMKNLREFMRDMNKFIVMGERKNLGNLIEINGKSIKVDDVISVTGGILASSVLWFNVFADTKNMLLNTLMLQSFAFTNTITGSKSLYGEKDVAKSVASLSTNPMLAKALSWQYKMAGMDRSNLLNNPRHLETTKAVLDTRHGYFGQFLGDYGIRTLSLMAHMNKKGVLDAHSLDKDGSLIYDETKDARMYTNGKITENGKLIKMELLKNMKEEGLFNGEVSLDSKLPQAFDNRLRDSIKTISDKFITGGAYDDATALNLEAGSIGKAFAVFKRYLPDKIQNLYLKGSKSSAIVDYVVKDITIDGETKATVVTEGMYMEGLVQSIAGLWVEARKHLSGSGEYKNLSEMFKGQEDIRRANLVRVTHDLIIANLFLSLLPIMFGSDDMTAEEKNHWNEVMGSPLGKSINYSFQDMINPYKPNDYFKALENPFFALTALSKHAEFFPALLGTTEGALDKWAEKNLGAYKSIEAISGNLSGTKSDKAKKKKNKKKNTEK